MNKHRIGQVIVLTVLAVLALFVIKRPMAKQLAVTDFESCQTAGGSITDGDPVTCTINGQSFDEQENTEPEVVIDTPKFGDLVSSPMTVSGKARGNWFFEGTMPMVLKDDKGNTLAEGPAAAQSNWMTSDFVPFTGTLTFDPGQAEYGVLIISRDNPSGDGSRDASIAIPVRFK